MTVVVVGDIVTDIVAVHGGTVAAGSDTPAAITITGGGAAANTAAWLASLGVPVTLVAVVGADAAGAERVAELRAAGVRCLVRAVPGASTGSIVVLSGGGDRTMLVDRGANGLLTASDVEHALAGARHVHVSGYTLLDTGTRPAGLAALGLAREWGATTSVDAASAAPLRSVGGAAFLTWTKPCDLLFANLDEARALVGSTPSDAESLASQLTTEVGGAAVVKRGADGAAWAAGGDVVSVPGQPAKVADPTGAGDAFAAGFLAGWLAGASPVECLEAGTALGAQAVTGVGSRPRSTGRPR
jgi:sugar/nucleoside kinase (ribokinase family)